MDVHADKAFRIKLTSLYDDLINDGDVVLDMMSSHVSHLPKKQLGRVDVHGMNQDELLANTARIQTNGNIFLRNLNETPSFLGLINTNASYDAILCCVGVQYLEEAEAVFAEVGRILKPGGVVVVSFTNRFFYQKALTGWIERGMSGRATLVCDYLRAAGGFGEVEVMGEGTGAMSQLLSVGGIGGDPYVAVVARRNDDP